MKLAAAILSVALATAGLAQVKPDPALRYNRNTYSPITEILQPRMGTITDQELDHLKGWPQP